MKIAGIYTIVNTSTGYIYVGQSTNLAFRFTRHKCDLQAGRHSNTYLQSAWNKHGKKSFKFSVICSVFGNDTNLIISRLNSLETHFILAMGSMIRGYNFTTGGDSKIPSDITRKKMSESHKGQIPHSFGKICPPETKAKISASLKGRPRPDLRGKGHTAWNKGKSGYSTMPASEERKRKIGEAQKGSKNHNFGKAIPEDVKKKIRGSNQGSKCYLAKLDEAKVLDIKKRLAGGERGSALASEYGVAATQISCIKKGTTWKHVIIQQISNTSTTHLPC